MNISKRIQAPAPAGMTAGWSRSAAIFLLGIFSVILACRGLDNVPASPQGHNRILGLHGPQLSEPAASLSAPAALRQSIAYQGEPDRRAVPLVLGGISGDALPGMPAERPADSLAALFEASRGQVHAAMQAGDTIMLKSGTGTPVRFKISVRRPFCNAADPAKAPVPDVNLIDCVPGGKNGDRQYVIEAVTVPVSAPAVQQSL
jgi:hypothetical protein